MIEPRRNDNKVVFGPCRLSYTHVMQKYAQEGSNEEGSYQTVILIPKTEKETLKALNAAIEAAKQTAKSRKWNGRMPAALDISLRDGDEPKNDGSARGDEYAGHMFMNAKSKSRPGVVNRDGSPITDEEEMYSGVWAVCSVSFFGYARNGKYGISVGLNNLMKWKDDDKLGGKASAAADFAGLDNDDDDM